MTDMYNISTFAMERVPTRRPTRGLRAVRFPRQINKALYEKSSKSLENYIAYIFKSAFV